jgi:hypothetical protein
MDEDFAEVTAVELRRDLGQNIGSITIVLSGVAVVFEGDPGVDAGQLTELHGGQKFGPQGLAETDF